VLDSSQKKKQCSIAHEIWAFLGPILTQKEFFSGEKIFLVSIYLCVTYRAIDKLEVNSTII
jgi:hypothetical protein